jgi:hypothetical protein
MCSSFFVQYWTAEDVGVCVVIFRQKDHIVTSYTLNTPMFSDLGYSLCRISSVLFVSRIDTCEQFDMFSQYLPYDVPVRLAIENSITIHLIDIGSSSTYASP